MSAEACLKHPWLDVKEQKDPDRDLSANKQKIKEVPVSNNNYYFDPNSRTMSVASNHEDLKGNGGAGDDEDWEWEEWDEPTEEPSEEPSKPTMKDVDSKAEPVITHEQVQAKAAEIRSPCFAQVKTSADFAIETASPLQRCPSETQPCPENAETNNDATAAEIKKSCSATSTVVEYDEDGNAETVYSAEIINHPSVQVVLTQTNNCAETAEQPPVWQAAERTLSPMWDVAKVGQAATSPTQQGSAIAEISLPPVEQHHYEPNAETVPNHQQQQQQPMMPLARPTQFPPAQQKVAHTVPTPSQQRTLPTQQFSPTPKPFSPAREVWSPPSQQTIRSSSSPRQSSSPIRQLSPVHSQQTISQSSNCKSAPMLHQQHSLLPSQQTMVGDYSKPPPPRPYFPPAAQQKQSPQTEYTLSLSQQITTTPTIPQPAHQQQTLLSQQTTSPQCQQLTMSTQCQQTMSSQSQQTLSPEYKLSPPNRHLSPPLATTASLPPRPSLSPTTQRKFPPPFQQTSQQTLLPLQRQTQQSPFTQHIPLTVQHFTVQPSQQTPPIPPPRQLYSPPYDHINLTQQTQNSAAGKKRRSDDCSSTSDVIQDISGNSQVPSEGNFKLKQRWHHPMGCHL